MPYKDPEKRRQSNKIRSARWRTQNPEKEKEKQKRFYDKHPGLRAEKRKRYQEKYPGREQELERKRLQKAKGDPDRYAKVQIRRKQKRALALLKDPMLDKRSALTRNFGITLEQFEQLEREQAFVCAICKKSEKVIRSGKLSRLSVDHCHKTNKVRGLLCTACNRGMGLLKDDLTVLQNAISYLQNPPADKVLKE